MIRTTIDVSPAARARHHAILDVRSPAEFAEDHLPGAINLPVLDNAERAEVGTLYVQTSKFLARRLGAARVARNIATHLETPPLCEQQAGFQPLIYCWRGGQRSNAMATVLAQVGWPVTLLTGGYKTWRRHVVTALHTADSPLALPPVMLIEGPTGSGKTALLSALAAIGQQTVDLEALAGHRGSLFGATNAPQPSQKLWESRLLAALEPLDPSRPLFLEAESSRIGNLAVPPRLWAAMQQAQRITVNALLEDRARHTVETYTEIAADRAALLEAVSRLPRNHSREARARWQSLAEAGDLLPLAADLMRIHYDPAYARSMARRPGAPLAEIPLTLTPEGLAQAATRIATLAVQDVNP
ncbi:tRNA 2-selenouridine(34) synthase MnmH [Sandaracinobacteroides hominis]|uniref:tRNA 2-selenouridine(34) synthase MnmH n=1 Tax=Sandaracinobacteroides hominis TaxID=2780086 RepID=UPI0018F70EC3|nr:tRNA 2-selenouridine(34) synthase MnmH [Sandaracinobacteroides hominis]